MPRELWENVRKYFFLGRFDRIQLRVHWFDAIRMCKRAAFGCHVVYDTLQLDEREWEDGAHRRVLLERRYEILVHNLYDIHHVVGKAKRDFIDELTHYIVSKI